MLKIQILGTGCSKCNNLTDNAKEAAETLGEAVEIEKITNLTQSNIKVKLFRARKKLHTALSFLLNEEVKSIS